MFLPRLQEKELPSKQARSDEEIAEERRLLYVGLTRAKRMLWLTWSGKRSRFLAELGVAASAVAAAEGANWTPDAQRLREWRLERAKADDVPPYVVFHDACCTRSPPRGRRRSASWRRSRRRPGEARALRRGRLAL